MTLQVYTADDAFQEWHLQKSRRHALRAPLREKFHDVFDAVPVSQLCQALRSTEIWGTVQTSELCEAVPFPEVWDAVPVSQLCHTLKCTEIWDTVLDSGTQ